MLSRRALVTVFAIGAVVIVVAIGLGAGLDRQATVTIRDEDGSVAARVQVRVANDPFERRQGLSGTASLEPGRGMLFVYDEAGERTYVMRDMNYPLDIVFVGADGRITAIYHAEVEHDDELTNYSARAKWVLEVPYGWTNETGVTVGDSVHITYS